jgi:topoisomerase-4 subunit A
LIELEPGTHLLHYYAANSEQALLLASSNGFGFIAKLGDMVSRVKAGKAYMTIDAGAVPLAPMPILPDATQVACLSSAGRLLVFVIDEMKTLSSGGRGITLMMLDDNETLVQALAIGEAGVMLVGTGRGGKPVEETLGRSALAPHVGKRARRGRAPDTRMKIAALRPALG